MPEIDTDLFKIITLGGLALLLILLLVALSSLSRLKRLVESRPTGDEARDHGAAAAVAAAPAAQAEPEQQEEPRAAEPEPQPVAQAEPEAAAVSATQEQPATSAYADHHDETSTTTAEPAATEEPQEQPFEREGRWWFKRGDELLVYDEGTGQWVAAPDPGSSGGPSPTQAQGGQLGGAAATEDVEDSGGFWKCPSCGATNGSTATTCRMCFAARP